jgi:hypothetical protein
MDRTRFGECGIRGRGNDYMLVFRSDLKRPKGFSLRLMEATSFFRRGGLGRWA